MRGTVKHGRVRRFAPIGGDGENRGTTRAGRRAPESDSDDLPYKVEIWDETKAYVEQMLAVTAHTSIGHAAFYAATRDFSGRYITLRVQGHVLMRWNDPDRH